MIPAFVASCVAALLLAFVCRASRPGMILSFLAGYWQAWLIMRPTWLNEKASGGCVLCTTFWWLGVPVALLAGFFTPAGPWALAVPPLVAVLSDTLLLL